MTAVSKRIKKINEGVDLNKSYSSSEAFALLKQISTVKFTESVDVAVKLGIDPRKSDQAVRGASLLPKGIGKTVKVAVFAQDEDADTATAAGADIVGYDELATDIKAGKFDFDVLIATPASMRVVGQLGQILGPRGLMPNPKVGTVTADVATAVKNAKLGQVRYRADKGGIVHCKLGNLDFSAEDLTANLSVLIADLKKARPTTAKGVYIKSISVSSTMGPGLSVDVAVFES